MRVRRLQSVQAHLAPAGGGRGAPGVVVIFSGKRKAGKDFVCEQLLERLGATAEIGRLSAPLKQAFAEEHGLDFEELLTDGPYKEKYRYDMIRWGEERRNADAGFFARKVVAAASAPVMIVSDARRPSDIEFFQAGASEGRWRLLTVRIEASQEVRAGRGWVYTPGVDDAESECALDGREWDVTLDNEGSDPAVLEEQLAGLQRQVVEGGPL